MPPAVVLVTGVSRWLGGALAAELASDPAIGRVLGVDTVPPGPELLRSLGRTEFVRADIRSPVIGRVVESAGVDTVVHLDIAATPAAAGSRASMKELNVVGTMHLLAACQASPAVRRFVLGSSTAVYGASPRDPAVFTETMQARQVPSGGLARDGLDVEGYVRAFARRRPDVGVAVLRLATVLGPRTDSALADLLRHPVVPTVLGADPRLQLLHEDDALAVLVRAATGDVTGTVNVAGEGTVLLSQAVRRLGRVPLPVVPGAVGALTSVGRRLGVPGPLDWTPEQLRQLGAARVVDTRRLREEFGYTPRATTAATLADFARTVDPVVRPEVVAGSAAAVRSAVGRVATGVRLARAVAAAALPDRPRPAPPVPGLRVVPGA